MRRSSTGRHLTAPDYAKVSISDVNDDKPGQKQRDVLRYFQNNEGRTINSTSSCGNWTLFNAPVPRSSSVPADRSATQPVVSTGSQGYRQLKVHMNLPLFY